MKVRPCPAGSWALSLDIWPPSPPWSLCSVPKRPLASARPAVPPESLPRGLWDGRFIGHIGGSGWPAWDQVFCTRPPLLETDQAFAPHLSRTSTWKALGVCTG